MPRLIFLALLALPVTTLAQCDELWFDHQADIPSTCNEMVMTMQSDDRGYGALYVANKEAGLRVYELTDPPQEIGHIPATQLGNTDVMSVTSKDSTVYLALGNHFTDDELSGMAIVDVADPTAPVLLDVWHHTETGGAGIVKVEGDYAYLGAMGNGLIILDISDPTDIQFVSQYVPTIDFPHNNPDPPKFNLRGMVVENGIVYACYDAGGMRIINATDPQNPVETGRYANPDLYNLPMAYNNLQKRGNQLFVAVDYCGMEVLDVSDTANVTLAGWWNPYDCASNPLNWFSSPGHANEIVFDPYEDMVYISAGKSELFVLDVSDPTMPDSCNAYGGISTGEGTWGVHVDQGLRVFLSYICAVIPFSSNWTGVRYLQATYPLSVAETANSQPLNLYPNPSTNGTVTVACAMHTQHATVRILDVAGKQLAVERFAGTSYELDVHSLPAGLYFVAVQSEHGQHTNTLVIR